MLLLAISFKKQCCDKVLAIVVRVLFTKTKKNFKTQSRNRYAQENCIGISYGQEPIKFYGLLLMEHSSYNKTFDSMFGFKATFETEDCAYVISAK